MEVYLLWHMRPLEGPEDLDPEMAHIETDDKLCGVYSTQARAEEAAYNSWHSPASAATPTPS